MLSFRFVVSSWLLFPTISTSHHAKSCDGDDYDDDGDDDETASSSLAFPFQSLSAIKNNSRLSAKHDFLCSYCTLLCTSTVYFLL